MALPEEFLKFETEQILYVQEKFQGIEPLLEFVSKHFGPTEIQFLVGPLLAGINGESVTEIMLATAVGEYFLIMLKILLREHRPFWWINEAPIYKGCVPKIRQHQLTCESSGGGPSGHSAIITIISYLQGKWLSNYLEKKFDFNRSVINIGIYSVLGSFVTLMWLSRMYFASHFLHQCVSGSTLALSVMTCLEQGDIRKHLFKANKKRGIGVALGMLFTVGSIYYGLSKWGLDPMWSAEKAIKYCESAKSVRIESTPIYSIVRNLGCTFGIGICAPLGKKTGPRNNRWRSIPLTIGFVLTNSIILANAPKEQGSCIFLAYVFAASAFHSYAMIELVPKFADMEEDEVGKEESSKKEDKSRSETQSEGEKQFEHEFQTKSQSELPTEPQAEAQSPDQKNKKNKK